MEPKSFPSFNTEEHVYLQVVQEREKEVLKVSSPQGWWGRLCMKLGWSSCSMKTVAKYLSEHGKEYSYSDENWENVKQKIEKYQKNHSEESSTCRKLQNFLDNTPLTDSKKDRQKLPSVIKEPEPPPSPLAPTPPEPLVTPSGGDIGAAQDPEVLQSCVHVISDFEPEGIFSQELWALAGGIGLNYSIMMEDLGRFQEDLQAKIEEVQGMATAFQTQYPDRSKKPTLQEVENALGIIVNNLRELDKKITGKANNDEFYVTEDEKNSFMTNYINMPKKGDVSVFKNLETRLRSAEINSFKNFINNMYYFSMSAGNSKEKGDILQSGIGKIRQCLVHRKPASAESLQFGAQGSAEAIFTFMLREYFGAEGRSALEPFTSLRLREGEDNQPGWIPITEIHHVHGNHFVNMVSDGEKPIYIDNMHPQERSETTETHTVDYTISLSEEEYNKLKERGPIIDMNQLCIPTWNANNCYLSSAFISFVTMLKFAEEAGIFHPETV